MVEHVKRLSLAELVDAIAAEFAHPARKDDTSLSGRTPVFDAMCAFDASLGELDRYSFFDNGKNYTRNLIATDNANWTLMLLCWNPGRESPVHDHPCEGCFMRVVRGSVREHRYEIDAAADTLTETAVSTASEGDVIYINDSLGLHKVVNPSLTMPAATLHLYAPPFTRCRVWLDRSVSKCLSPVTTYHSTYGEPVVYELGASAVSSGVSNICDVGCGMLGSGSCGSSGACSGDTVCSKPLATDGSTE